jgi:hypothetical protein
MGDHTRPDPVFQSNAFPCKLPGMSVYRPSALLIGILALSGIGRADDVGAVKKAVERSTLNQPGTKPFHLKAALAPSRERDKDSGRSGEVEIWWASPTQWKHEVRSPEFHQIDIVNGSHEWQKSDGEYFPEWLREVAVALIEPVPLLDQVLDRVRGSDARKIAGMIHFSWTTMSTDGHVQKGMGGALAISDKTGLLLYGSDLAWSGLFHDYMDFHGRMVAQTVAVGSPEVTAKVTTLEDLGVVPAGFFDAEASGGDAPPLRTLVIEETALRRNLLPTEPVAWPPLQDGPLDGAVTTRIVVDRAGKVREVGTVVADNPGVNDIARKVIAGMQFKPYLQDGVAVQVVSRITMPFKTFRPAGVETFDSARAYFERGRRVGFPAAGNGPAYILHATFQAKLSSGTVEAGQYVDTWKSDDEWRREVSIGQSRYVRARHGEARYQLTEGPDATHLRLVLKAMEPIPAIDTFTESDWKIKRDTVDGAKTIRVLTGYENPDGSLDPENARGYWFDDSGKLVKTYFQGLETRRAGFEDYNGIQIAHEISVLHNGALGMLIRVTQVSPAGTVPENTFDLPGHEWTRAFTEEVR